MTQNQSNESNTNPLGIPVSNLDPSPPLHRAPLQGSRVVLLPLDTQRDIAELYDISHSSPEKESIWTYLGYGPFAGPEKMHDWLEARQRSTDPMFFTVTDRQSSARLGLVSFLAIDLPSRSLELGHIWYATTCQRGHTNTETIYLMLCEAFEQMNCRRVEWKCDANNRRSKNAAIRLGFQPEGTFRQHRIVKGRNRDTAWFSILDHEWPVVKNALEAWLNWEVGRPPSLASLRISET